MSKKKLIIIAICILVLLAGVGIAAMLLIGKDNEPGSMGWKQQQYGATCERGVTEGLYTNTTEYGICTRDLGYDIKGIEPEQSEQDTSETPTNTTPFTDSDEQTQEGKRMACVSLRATALEDLIETNKQNGVSEADTRITYSSGIAQCDDLGY